MDLSRISNCLQQIEPQGHWQIGDTPIRSRECDVYRADNTASGRSVAVKAYHPGTPLGTPKHQYNTLLKKQETLADADQNFRVPKVYLFDQEDKILAMEWASGTTMVHDLWRLPFSTGASDSVALAGQWLRALHGIPQPKEGTVNLSSYMAIVQKRLDRSKRAPKSAFFKKALSALTGITAGASKVNSLLVVPHGDFTPYNLLIDGETVTGVDMSGMKYKSAYDDLARMTVYLSVAYPCFFLGTLFDQKGKLHPRILPLYTSYGTNAIDIGSTHLKVALLSEYLRRWVVIDNRNSGRFQQVTNYLQIKRIQQQLSSILRLLKAQ